MTRFQCTSFLFISLVLIIAQVHADERPIIQTSSGKVRGVIGTSAKGREFSQFKGIPYVESPVGSLRFKDPVYKKPWAGIWEATNEYQCTQIFITQQPSHVVGQEDCLYLNIYVPRNEINEDDNLDVFVHIHGGAFMFGDQQLYAGPKYLMDEDLILVTMNYRLGPFGFLSTEDDVVSGNMGLKDQSMALIWIKENIKNFGGNPNSVTISGMSAGGASVHFHYFSSKSNGLFQQGYSLSGTALAPWALTENAAQKAKKLSELVGCPTKTSEELIHCMRQRSSTQIIEASKEFYTYKIAPFVPFGPVVETGRTNAFLKEHPYSMLLSGENVADVPWITSVTKDEGVYPAGLLYNDIEDVEEKWDDVIARLMAYDETLPESKHAETAKLIREHYLGSEKLSKENIYLFIKSASDRLFFQPAELAIRMQSKVNKEPVYFYRLAYADRHSFGKLYGLDIDLGVAHGQDVLYFFSSAHTEGERSKDDLKMIDLYTGMIASYSKTGKPMFGDAEWKPVQHEGKIDFLSIYNPNLYNMAESKELYPKKLWHQFDFAENENLFKTAEHDEL